MIEVKLRGPRQNITARAIQATAAHIESPETFPKGFGATLSGNTGKLVYGGFEDCPIHAGDWLVLHGSLNYPVALHFDAATFEIVYKRLSDGAQRMAAFIDLKPGVDRFFVFGGAAIIALIAVGVAIGVGIYHLAFAK